MVTREHPTAETQKLVDWFLSPQGQLVQDVGYVPLYRREVSKKGCGRCWKLYVERVGVDPASGADIRIVHGVNHFVACKRILLLS